MAQLFLDELPEEANYCVELNTPRRFNFKKFPEFKQMSPNKYLAQNLTRKQAKSLTMQLRLRGMNPYFYKNIWSRGNDYRKKFLETQPEPCRCVYCGRFFPKASITVDHVIPVDLAKRSTLARWKLERQGYESIDDPRNLVPACHKCNNKKKNLNLFRYRFLAHFGKYDWFWKLRIALIVVIVIIALVLIGLLVNYLMHHSLSEISTTIQTGLEKFLINLVDRFLGPLPE